MRLILLISNLGSGGAERQLVTLAVLFKERGIDVEFVIYHKSDFYKHILDTNKIKVTKLNTKNNFDRIIQVRKFIRQSECDAVISFLEVNNFIASVAAIGGKKWKLIINELSAKKSTFLTLRGKIFGWFHRYSDAIICNSHNARGMWEKYFPEYKNKLSVIYNPVLLSEIKSQYIPKRDDKLHIVVAASYQYLKNPIGLIKALALMNEDEREKIIVNWYGNQAFGNIKTNAFREAIELIALNKLEDCIKLNEPTKDILNKMNEADVVALFSELEGLPNAICEGMMMGKPIIMSKVSDYNTLVDESNGFLCDWDNSRSIKDTLIKAIDLSPEELMALGKVSKDKATNLFLPKNIINQWIKVLSR